MNLRFRINDEIQRSDIDIIDKLSMYQVANLGDSMNRMGCIPSSRLKPVNNVKMRGSAYTVRVPEGDNLMIYYAIDNAKEGDIIVIDGNGNIDRALIGEIMISYALTKKVGGFVVNGAIRDHDALKDMPIPIYFAGVSPNGPYKNGPGEVNFPVSIHGLVINPGDILVGDSDGIVVIGPEDASVLLEEVEKTRQKEEKIFENIENGTFDISWVYEKLKENNVEFEGDK